MAKAVKVDFVLVGPRAGTDFEAQEGVKFKKGVYTYEGSSDTLEHLENLLRISHNAYPENSEGIVKARKAWDENPGNPENLKKQVAPAKPASQPAAQ